MKISDDSEEFEAKLDLLLIELRTLMVAKNRAYGNSALAPLRIFSRADPIEQLRVRIDDKLSRLRNSADDNEDSFLDLLGYLLLLRLAKG